MEVCACSSRSSCLDGFSNSGSLKIPLKTPQNTPTDLSVSDLKTCLDEVLVKDGIDVKKSEKKGSVIWENEINVNDSVHSASENFPSKGCTFPPDRESSSSVDLFFLEGKQKEHTADADFEVNALDGSINQSCLQSKSLPTTSKLVSALKGSREKQGMPPKKLSVTWAPDVYDPIPTSVSHVPTSKNQHYRSYGKRKNKQKRGGKSSRNGSKDSREKKQTRKNVGTSSLKLKPILDYDRGIEVFTEPIGNPNPFCGSSLLLKNSVSEAAFSTC